jgi:hypothetical protein
MTITYTGIATSSSSATGIVVGAATTLPSNVASSGGPIAVGLDELFFWTRKWQADEAESLEARRRGEVRTFDTGRDAVRWLLDCED